MQLNAPLDDILGTPSHVRVLRALYRLPAGLAVSAREVARRASLSHPTASKALASLAQQGLVTRTRSPRASAFELRRSHTAVEQLGALFAWEGRLRQELVAFLRTEILHRASGSVTAAYLFGSAAEGDMTASSDIDVAVLHAPCAAERLQVALEEIAAGVEERFGNRLSFILSASAPEQLQSSRRAGYRLWRKVLRRGLPILETEAGG